MQGNLFKKVTDRFSEVLLAVVLMVSLTAPSFLTVPFAYAATSLSYRYDKISNSSASAVTSHLIGFDFTDNTVPIGSILMEFCSNTPIIGDSCVVPVGFDISGSSLIAQSGESGFSILAPSLPNAVILTRPASLPINGSSSYEFSNVINPSVSGSYYLRLQTFTSVDATGIAVQEGGVALSVNGPLTVQTTVPPHLTFCASVSIVDFDCTSASSFFINFGEFSETETKIATSQMVAATNAEFGYSIYSAGTTFTSGNNIIQTPTAPTQINTGESQFGINLRANTIPNIGEDAVGPGTASARPNYAIPNRYMYLQGDSIVSADHSQDWKKFTVSYIVNIASDQPPGVYSTTMTYICLANF